MKTVFIVGVILLSAQLVSAAEDVEVISGVNILPNGKVETSEWQDAKKIETSNDINLHFKQDSTYLYICIEFVNKMHTGIDLYLAKNEGNRKMLHVSSAIGEKTFNEGEWSDYDWGGNKHWIANSIGTIYVDGKNEIVPLEGFEFQIDKSMFNKDEWYLMIHLKRPELIYPENATSESTEHWLKINL